MSSVSRLEYGLICDRTAYGLGRRLIATAHRRESVNIEDPRCNETCPHNHDVVVRMVTTSDWGPLDGIGNSRPRWVAA